MIYVIFRWKKGGNESALSANYLQGDTRLCKSPEMGHGFCCGTSRLKPCCFLARSSVSGTSKDLEHSARKQTWALHEIHWNEYQGGAHSGVSELLWAWTISATRNGPEKRKPFCLAWVIWTWGFFLLQSPPRAAINVTELQTPCWICHWWGTGLALLKRDEEGQKFSSHLQEAAPPLKSAAAPGEVLGRQGHWTGKEDRGQAVSRGSRSSFAITLVSREGRCVRFFTGSICFKYKHWEMTLSVWL